MSKIVNDFAQSAGVKHPWLKPVGFCAPPCLNGRREELFGWSICGVDSVTCLSLYLAPMHPRPSEKIRSEKMHKYEMPSLRWGEQWALAFGKWCCRLKLPLLRDIIFRKTDLKRVRSWRPVDGLGLAIGSVSGTAPE